MTQETEQNGEERGDDRVSSSSLVAQKIKRNYTMEFLLKRGAGGSFLKAGDIVEGVVIEKRGSRVYCDLGIQGIGLIYGREYYVAQDIISGLKPGDTVSAKVVEPDNEEGYIELSLKDAGEERRWFDLEKMMRDGDVLELPVLEANRGGLILEVKGVKGFLPASQLSSKHYPRVEGGDKEKIYVELQKLVGESLKVKILDLKAVEEKLIFTEKELDRESLRATLHKYKIGDEVEGEVTGVVDFGAFMKFDETGLEGLIHISEIDWTLIENPREVLKPGDTLRAKIIDIQGGKVSLSLKALKEDPWKKIAEQYKKGDVVKGTVTKFNPFGAFAELGHQIQGLVHISEFGTEAKMKEALVLGQEYPFKVLLVDPAEHRMSLGMHQEGGQEGHEEGQDAGKPVSEVGSNPE